MRGAAPADAKSMLPALARCAARAVAARPWPVWKSHVMTTPARPPLLNWPPTTVPHARRASTGPTSAGAASSTRFTPTKSTAAVADHWASLLSSLSRPAALRLASAVDPTHVLGLSPRSTYPPLTAFFAAVKAAHPTKVALVRVGEFYEAVGIDAVMLVEHAGLNPMGAGDTPRAGCPASNLRRTLDCLLEAGVSVAVAEEAPEPYRYGARARQKERYVAGVVTPAAPHYIVETADLPSTSASDTLHAAPPILGVAAGPLGYTTIAVDAALRVVRVRTAVTEDAVTARLHAGGLAPPLYLFDGGTSSSSSSLSSTRVSDSSHTAEAEWRSRVASLFRASVGAVARYSGRDPVEALLDTVRRDLGLDADAPFEVLQEDGGGTASTTRPHPLPLSTASQLGIHRQRGIPSLVDALLPPHTPLVARRWLTRLLLLPPPADVAADLRAAVEHILKTDTPLPPFIALPAPDVVVKLRARQAGAGFFHDVSAMLASARAAATDDELAPFARSLLSAVALETGHAVALQDLIAVCDAASAAIDRVVVAASAAPPPVSTSLTAVARAELEAVAAADTPLLAPFTDLVLANETAYQSQVLDGLVAAELAAVAAARARVASAAAAAVAALPPQSSSSRTRPDILYDSINNALWLRANKASASTIHPTDRYGRRVAERASTTDLEAAVDAYRRATLDARAAVARVLRQLACELEPMTAGLIAVATWTTIASALEAHARAATARGWALPQLGCVGTPLTLRSAWPYWIDRTAATANDVTLTSLALLTGPNMAGKSTILRTAASVALLASCGLAAPCATGTVVPPFSTIILRVFAADAPEHGRSSFALEMDSTRHILEAASPSALILVDELGKGTEPAAGAAVAGAVLEALAAAGAAGLFATHLHTLLDLPLKGDIGRLCMETVALDDGRLKPTWRVVSGSSTASLALDVAADSGVPPAVVSRARQLYQGLMPHVEPPLASADVAGLTGGGGVSRAAAVVAAAAVAAPKHTLAAAADVLTATVTRTLASQPLQAAVVPPGWAPPPSAAAASAVYVLKRSDNFFYAGSSDDLPSRLAAHRTSGPVADPALEATYVLVTNKSDARAAEAAVIQALRAAGFPLVSDTDARHGRAWVKESAA